eukprot:m.117577 g.117577  ORF g.117577 m.117577 type:complete len:617 (-) comp14253_c0_seq2:3672-5522(-)
MSTNGDELDFEDDFVSLEEADRIERDPSSDVETKAVSNKGRGSQPISPTKLGLFSLFLRNEKKKIVCCLDNCTKQPQRFCDRCGRAICRVHMVKSAIEQGLKTDKEVHNRCSLLCVECHRTKRRLLEQHIDGISRNVSDRFKQNRKHSQLRRKHSGCGTESVTHCKLLAHAYAEYLGLDSGNKRKPRRHSSLASADEQEWSKVNKKPSLAQDCGKCGKVFSLFRKKYFCRLCGRLFCDDCLFRSLQIYVQENKVVLDLITPEHCVPQAVLLRGCEPCLDDVEKELTAHKLRTFREQEGGVKEKKLSELGAQVSDSVQMISIESWDSELQTIHQQVMTLRIHIVEKLPVFRDIVESMSDANSENERSEYTGSLSKHKSPVKKVATEQINLTAIFRELRELTEQIGRLRKRIKGSQRVNLANECCKAHVVFYRKNLWSFRVLKKELSAVVPQIVLDTIANEMNISAVTNILVVLQQFCIESLMYPELEDVSQLLMHAMKLIENNLSTLVREQNVYDWESYRKTIESLVSEMLKKKPILSRFGNHPNREDKILQSLHTQYEHIVHQVKYKILRPSSSALLTFFDKNWRDIVRAFRDLHVSQEWEILSSEELDEFQDAVK